MSHTIRRVLLVLVLIAAALPWLTGPQPVRAEAEDEAKNTESTTPKKPEKESDPSQPSAQPANNPGPNSGMTLPTGSSIAIVEIDGPILYSYQLDSLKRRVDRAINDGADLIVFELNTPGGDLLTSLDMSAYIRTLNVPTVAWVNTRALSAGILIASACDELVMSRASQTGDCAPIVPGQNLAPTERAKALSPLLAEFRANAKDNYSGSTTNDFALFHAMCVLGIDVYQVRHKKTGELRLVSQSDYEVMVNGKSPIDVANIGKSSASPNNTGNTPATLEQELGDVTAPIVTVTDKSQMGQWELVKQVHNGSLLLVTMSEDDALDVGLSRATLSSEAEIKKHYGAASIQRYDETWSESLVGFLVHPVVRAGLLLLGVVGLLIEYLSPGLFLPGIIGLAAFGVVIGAPYFVGLAQTWHLLLILIGAALIIYELFTMTTFGVLAILGLLMFLAGLVLSGVQSASNGLPAPGSNQQIFVASMSFLGSILLTVPALFVLTHYMGSLPIFNKLVLNDSQAASLPADGSSAAPHQRVSGDESVGGGAIKPGMIGTVTKTGLRPTGRIEIEDLLIDVTSSGGFVEPGVSVVVLEVHGNVITVEPGTTEDQA